MIATTVTKIMTVITILRAAPIDFGLGVSPDVAKLS